LDEPFTRCGTLDVDPAAAQRLDRHVDVRHAGQLLAGVDEVQADIEARGGQQQPRDELAGGGGVDLDTTTANAAVPAHGEGHRPGAFVVDVDAEVTQGGDRRPHGSVQRRLMGGDD